MMESNRKLQLLGKSIRKIRKRRKMTQRELSEATQLSEPAVRCYELGLRHPKPDALEQIAKALNVEFACFDTYGIECRYELMHALFLIEDRFGIEPCADGSIRFSDKAIQSYICTWWSWKELLEEGKITKEGYEDRKDAFKPKPDDALLEDERMVKVRCVETGVVYNSICEAAQETEVPNLGIAAAVSGIASGYHWEYVDG